jgi:hypothetical protein
MKPLRQTLGIILLIVEINQNNELVRVQIEQMRSDTYVAWQREIASGDHVAPLFAKTNALSSGSSDFDLTQLDPIEFERYFSIAAARYYDYETMYAQYQRGFVSEEYWKQRIVPGVREWAPTWAKLFGADGLSHRHGFQNEVDRILEEKN